MPALPLFQLDPISINERSEHEHAFNDRKQVHILVKLVKIITVASAWYCLSISAHRLRAD